MFKKIFKKSSIKYLILIFSLVVIVILSLLFYPFLNFKNSVKDKTGQNTRDYVVKNYNPIQPTISRIVALDDKDSYLIYTSKYQRIGLFEFEDMSQSQVYYSQAGLVTQRVDKKSLEETKKIVENNQTETYNKSEIEKEKQLFEENTKPPECQRLLEFTDLNRQIKDFNFLKKDDSFSVFWNKMKEKGAGYKKDGLYFFDIRIDDKNNQNVIKLSFITNENPVENLETKIFKINLVDQNCKQTEVPVKSDNTFDFDEALKQL